MESFKQINGETFKKIRVEELSLDKVEVSKLFDVSLATIYNIEKKAGFIPDVYRLALIGLKEELKNTQED